MKPFGEAELGVGPVANRELSNHVENLFAFLDPIPE